MDDLSAQLHDQQHRRMQGVAERLVLDAHAIRPGAPYHLFLGRVACRSHHHVKPAAYCRQFALLTGDGKFPPYAQQGRMYLDFPGTGEEGERLLRDTFGDNYGRLQAIKHKYDPGNIFRFNPNVRPAA